jgi:hypothetical protein
MAEIFMKIKAGRETEKTNLEVISTKFSLITFIRLMKYPRAIIRKTGATIFPV